MEPRAKAHSVPFSLGARLSIALRFQSHLGRAGMRVQAFAVCQHRRDGPQALRARCAHFNEAAAFLKVIDAQGR